MTHEQRKISAVYLKSTILLKEDLTKRDEAKNRTQRNNLLVLQDDLPML